MYRMSFRTPLTPIKGYTDLLLMGAAGELSDPQADMLTTIKENVERLTVLVNDVLNIAKIDSQLERLAMHPVELNEFVPSEFNKIANRSIKCREAYQDIGGRFMIMFPSIRADREKAHQKSSLISLRTPFNYTRANGKIDIIVALQPGGRDVLITIEDTGVGIS